MSFEIERFAFTEESVLEREQGHVMLQNWPVVYVLNNDRDVYVGESLNASLRMKQHLTSSSKSEFHVVRVILEKTFNKSVCLDLESHLIRWFSGDGEFRVTNRNDGVTNANYYSRDEYQRSFEDIFEELRTAEHLFRRTVPEIENTELFKYSPFKSLTHDQALAVEEILEGLFQDLERNQTSSRKLAVPSVSSTKKEDAAEADNLTVVQGTAGTGKTIVVIYLLKLLCDIRDHDPEETVDGDSMFADFYVPDCSQMLQGLRLGMVVPQQSLRTTISRVFKKIPGMKDIRVMTPFQVGDSTEDFDLLFVDEAHRLNQRANQASGPLNKKFAEINVKLFGNDLTSYTQLDWIRTKSRHTILMLDQTQTVRPADLPMSLTRSLVGRAQRAGRFHRLQTQMRIHGNEDYLGYVKAVLSNTPPVDSMTFTEYDLRFYNDFGAMRQDIIALNETYGLCRLVAGYAWEWKSRKDNSAMDIEIGGHAMQWNRVQTDWINTSSSIDEMGSIHTVQGYDLNWAGVVIGQDIYFDETTQRIQFNRASYFDKKGRENNPTLGITYTDEQLLEYVLNIYHVLLTRGMRGTYIYVCDAPLRRHLSRYFRRTGGA